MAIKVLIADDNKLILAMAQEALEAQDDTGDDA
jgi:hypothetical protein